MDVREAASLLGLAKDRVIVAIETGVRTAITGTLVKLKAAALANSYDIEQEDLDAYILAFEKEEPGRHPPVAIRRSLLIEAGYKCAVCRDNGPIEFHHIIDWAKLKHHDEQHMLAVCANCHGKITRYGEPDFQAQRKIKESLPKAQAQSTEVRQTRDMSTATAGVPAAPSPSSNVSSVSDIGAIEPPNHTTAAQEHPSVSTSHEEMLLRVFHDEIPYGGIYIAGDEDMTRIAARLFAPVPKAGGHNRSFIMLLRAAWAITELRQLGRRSAPRATWINCDRLTDATANVLAELGYDVNKINNLVTAALEKARELRCLQFKREDEWQPGMESGSGWVEKVSLSAIGQRILTSTDAIPHK